MMSSLPSTEKEKENRVCMRKGSEPPPSLQAIFSRDSIGSSRRWSNRQFSVPNNTSASMVTLNEDSEKKKRKESSNNALASHSLAPPPQLGQQQPGHLSFKHLCHARNFPAHCACSFHAAAAAATGEVSLEKGRHRLDFVWEEKWHSSRSKVAEG